MQIDDNQHILRYCKPSSIRNGIPLASAFLIKVDQEYLSVNWLEYFRKGNLEQAVNCVRKIFLDKGYGIRVNGRFVKLQVGKVLSAILESGSSLARVEHLPENDDPSHCGIFGYAANDLYVAGIIAYMIHVENDVYPGKLTQH